MSAATPTVATVWEIRADGSITVYAAASRALARTGLPARRKSLGRPARPPGPLRAAIAAAATTESLSDQLIEAVAWTESRFHISATSPAGAYGIMQLMPATASDLGVDRTDLGQNVAGGSAYLRRLLNRYQGDTVKALAAYNAGPAAVDRHGGTPPYPETQHYVAQVLDRLASVTLPPENLP